MPIARDFPDRPFVGAGVIAWQASKVLLVRRANPPMQGAWSIPGGLQQVGEPVRTAALRELEEETGLRGEVLGLVDVVDSIWPDNHGRTRHHYTLVDFAVAITGGTLGAADDALEAAWHPAASLPGLGIWDETLRIIEAARRFF